MQIFILANFLMGKIGASFYYPKISTGLQKQKKGDGHLKVQFIFEILHAPQFWIFAPKFKIEVHAKILNYQTQRVSIY